jgi:hypothetical protein
MSDATRRSPGSVARLVERHRHPVSETAAVSTKLADEDPRIVDQVFDFLEPTPCDHPYVVRATPVELDVARRRLCDVNVDPADPVITVDTAVRPLACPRGKGHYLSAGDR